MANLSDLFPSSGGGSLPGGMTKDPRFLPMVDGTGGIAVSNNTYNASAENFWTASKDSVSQIGAVLTAATANTYGTICDLTGRGYLFHVIPALHAATTSTVSFRITVDGVEYVIEKVGGMDSTNAGGRLALGCAVVQNTASAVNFYTEIGNHLTYFGQNSSTVGSFRTSGQAFLIQPWRIIMEGMPCVFFEESLKVETKVSALASPSTYSQYSAATYKLL